MVQVVCMLGCHLENVEFWHRTSEHRSRGHRSLGLWVLATCRVTNQILSFLSCKMDMVFLLTLTGLQ